MNTRFLPATYQVPHVTMPLYTQEKKDKNKTKNHTLLSALLLDMLLWPSVFLGMPVSLPGFQHKTAKRIQLLKWKKCCIFTSSLLLWHRNVSIIDLRKDSTYLRPFSNNIQIGIKLTWSLKVSNVSRPVLILREREKWFIKTGKPLFSGQERQMLLWGGFECSAGVQCSKVWDLLAEVQVTVYHQWLSWY